MYNPNDDIRTHYRVQIKLLTKDIESRNRRDPALHRLRADRKLLQSKLRTLETSHTLPVGALADYGVW